MDPPTDTFIPNRRRSSWLVERYGIWSLLLEAANVTCASKNVVTAGICKDVIGRLARFSCRMSRKFLEQSPYLTGGEIPLTFNINVENFTNRNSQQTIYYFRNHSRIASG